ncbi:MAG: ABC transporter permease, partial [Oscillospiraceae bacterium]|nr:ABC transporter permease [Oscillospiraceae bacterium]
MNIFNRVALQALKKARTRTIVTIIGVILSVAMITAVTTFIASLQNNLIQGTIAKSGDWQVKFRDVNSNFLQKAASEEEVKTVAVMQNVGYTPLPGGTNPSKPYLYVTGLDDAAFRTIPLKLKAGRLPQNSGEIIVPAHIEATGGAQLHVGDSVTWALGGRTIEGKKVWQNTPFQNGERENSAKETFAEETVKTFTIVGIFKRPSFEEYAAPGYTAITKMDLERGEGKNSLDVYVTLKKPGKIYEYAKRIGANTTHEFNQDLLLFYGVSTNDSFNAVLYSLGGILIIMIMIGSILLIYNSFAISVSERARQFGILSSVGATQKQLQKSVLFEGVCIGMIGIPLGLLAGVGGIGITLHF